MPHITFEITENSEVIKTVNKETGTEPRDLIISLENFRQVVNETLTSMIEDNGEIDTYINDDDESSSDDSVPQMVSPKKRRK